VSVFQPDCRGRSGSSWIPFPDHGLSFSSSKFFKSYVAPVLFSASRFKSLAYCLNTTPKSGIAPFANGNIKPENFSSIANNDDPSLFGFSSNVRTPLNIGANPPVQVMRSLGTTPETVGVKVRVVPGTCTVSLAPSRICPSMRLTVEFQRGNSSALVRSRQIFSGFDRIAISTRHDIENVLCVCVIEGSLISLAPILTRIPEETAH